MIKKEDIKLLLLSLIIWFQCYIIWQRSELNDKIGNMKNYMDCMYHTLQSAKLCKKTWLKIND